MYVLLMTGPMDDIPIALYSTHSAAVEMMLDIVAVVEHEDHATDHPVIKRILDLAQRDVSEIIFWNIVRYGSDGEAEHWDIYEADGSPCVAHAS